MTPSRDDSAPAEPDLRELADRPVEVLARASQPGRSGLLAGPVEFVPASDPAGGSARRWV